MKSDATETELIELELLLEAVYRKYHYDFRRYSPALSETAAAAS
jgi:hypothetical protein